MAGGEERALLAQTAAVIAHKLLQELARLDATDVEAAGGAAPLSGNRRLALDYRARCRAVLEAALAAMDEDEVLRGIVEGAEEAEEAEEEAGEEAEEEADEAEEEAEAEAEKH